MRVNPVHFEILVEDQSGKKVLSILIPKIIGDEHTFRVHSYKGIGRVPRGLGGKVDANKRILLDRLPKLLMGYGNTFENYPGNYPAAVIFVCDLDDKCLHIFRQELLTILANCNPKPKTRFCFAIEEFEAWLLGDMPAIKIAYPKSKRAVLNGYVNDSVCGTWELLADAIIPGGSHTLAAKGWQATGAEKSAWAEKITPQMDVENNASASFCYFRERIRELAGEAV